jgi:hypothetical protein
VTAAGDEFLTVAEIAGILKLNPQTVRNWISVRLRTVLLELWGLSDGVWAHRPARLPIPR